MKAACWVHAQSVFLYSYQGVSIAAAKGEGRQNLIDGVAQHRAKS